MHFLLASASPRRAELLAAAGYAFDVDHVAVDERRIDGEAPAAYVERVAQLKAAAGAARHPTQIVIGADTAVVLGDTVLGKPVDEGDAQDMLRQLSGCAHDVLTGVAVAFGGDVQSAVERTTVWFRDLSDDEIQWYLRTGEPMDKAGGYGIQGRAARFIPRIAGSYSNVVGLPIARLADLISRVGSSSSVSER
jgi:septum formation protein